MIFYFTGTGNSQYVAQSLAREGERVISIGECLRNGRFAFDVLGFEPVGIVCPVYFGGLPMAVVQFLDKLELSEQLSAFQGPILWVSHDRGEVFRNCRRVCVLDRGASQGTVTLEELFHRPATEAAAQLSGCKNYADAVPQGDAVLLPQWGLTLSCGRAVPADTRRVGIRAHHVRPAESGENAFSVRVLRVVEDVFSTIVLLRPEGAAEGVPPLRMELDKETWQAISGREKLTVSVQAEDILLLRPSGERPKEDV